jgi:hypothetical protein
MKFDLFFQFIAGVIGAHCDSHPGILQSRSRGAVYEMMLTIPLLAVHSFSPRAEVNFAWSQRLRRVAEAATARQPLSTQVILNMQAFGVSCASARL